MGQARRARGGFTLVEMLVAVGIVVVLIAILFPVFSTSRERARLAQCETHLKVIATGLREFRGDNGRYPNSLGRLRKGYITNGGALHCPSDPVAGRDSYELFYAPRGTGEGDGPVTLACAMHGGNSGLLLHVGGEIDYVDFQTAELSGEALVRRRDSEVFGSPGSEPLQPGDIVRTASHSATLTFEDGSTAVVLPESELSICALAQDRDSVGSHILLYLYWGEIIADVVKLLDNGSTFEVATPAIIAGVRGTRFRVHVERDTGRSTVTVYRGVVQVYGARGPGSRLTAGKQIVRTVRREMLRTPPGGANGVSP